MQLAESGILTLITLAGGSAMVSYILGFGVWRMLRAWQVIDKPNERSSHVEPTPRGGGLGMMALFLSGAAILSWGTGSGLSWVVTAAAGVLAAVSFWDDRHPLPWWVRLGVQFFTALAVTTGLRTGAGWEGIGLGVLLILLLAGYANAFNFMDGINGLAAGQAVISAAGTVAVAVAGGVSPTHPAVLLSVLLAGVAAGFLPHNFPKARMFMGDVGSVPLGFLLMAFSVWIVHDGGHWLWMPLGALHTGFILDTGVTMMRRILRGEKVYQAHRDHFYQHLIRAGWSHQAVTGSQMGMALGVLAMIVGITLRRPDWLPLALAATVVVWTAYFVFCEREFSRRDQ